MKRVLDALQKLLTTQTENPASPLFGVKRVYFGDPIIIPEANLPAIALAPVESAYRQRGSRYDEKTHTIEIRLIYNIKQYFENDKGGIKNIQAAAWSAGVITITATGHGLAVGDGVTISSALPLGYNGTYRVDSTPTANTLTVARATTP